MENADGMLWSLHEKNVDRKLQSLAIKKVNAGSIWVGL